MCDIHLFKRGGILEKHKTDGGEITAKSLENAKEGFRRTCFYAGPAIAYAALIFFLSSLSGFPEEIPSFSGFDKIAHFFEYYIFGCLLYRWFSSTNRHSNRRKAFWMTVAVGTLYALTDEWHQSFVPERHASLWDAAVDAAGIGTGATTYDALVRSLFPKKRVRGLKGRPL